MAAQPVFARPRSGAFAEYNDLLTYYVGLGGNRNTTTRFRRYIGDPVQPSTAARARLWLRRDVLLVPNRKQTITPDRGSEHYRIQTRRQ